MARSTPYWRRTVRGARAVDHLATSSWTSRGVIDPIARFPSAGARWMRQIDSSRARPEGRFRTPPVGVARRSEVPAPDVARLRVPTAGPTGGSARMLRQPPLDLRPAPSPPPAHDHFGLGEVGVGSGNLCRPLAAHAQHVGDLDQ